MRVLVTGSSGRIGSHFVQAVDRSAFDIRRADLVHAPGDYPASFVTLDVTDARSCRAACAGMDAVLHLAGDPSPTAPFRSSVLPVNIAGTYNMVEAALAEGVARFVFASSAQAVEGYPADHQVREGDAPWPANDYGAGKAFGEALCSAASTRGEGTFVSVRIGNYQDEAPGDDAAWRDRTAWLSPADAVQLLAGALTAPIGGHTVAHGVSDNAVKRLSIDATRRVLGYAPIDDAFR